MEIVLRKYGNSTVLAFPPPLLRDLGLAAGQSMTLHARADGSITLAPKRKYTLKQLLAQCDLKAAPPRDLALWDDARPAVRSGEKPPGLALTKGFRAGTKQRQTPP